MDWLVFMGKLVMWSFAVVATLAMFGLAFQMIAEKLYTGSPPGQLIRVSGRNMHLLCKGEPGQPTVILETGGGNSSLSSRSIQSKIAQFARVCAYDRAGYGFSESVHSPRTFNDLTYDLDTLLIQAGVEPPYLLVGESMGGLMVRNYYRHFQQS